MKLTINKYDWLHIITELVIVVLTAIYFKSLDVGVLVGIIAGILKEMFDAIAIKFSESWKKVIRKLHLSGCTGWSKKDIIFDIFGIFAGIAIYPLITLITK